MSIRGKTGRGRSHSSGGNRALDLFTDRQQFTCRFAKYLNDYPPPEKILYFHGGGGNGKSLLLKFLRQKCCKHFQKDIWRELKVKSDAEIAREIEEYSDSEKFDWIPAVTHDFGLPPRGDDRPQDPFYGLLMLRRNLGNAAQALGYPDS